MVKSRILYEKPSGQFLSGVNLDLFQLKNPILHLSCSVHVSPFDFCVARSGDFFLLNARSMFCSRVLLSLMVPRCDFRCRPDFVAQLVSHARSLRCARRVLRVLSLPQSRFGFLFFSRVKSCGFLRSRPPNFPSSKLFPGLHAWLSHSRIFPLGKLVALRSSCARARVRVMGSRFLQPAFFFCTARSSASLAAADLSLIEDFVSSSCFASAADFRCCR
jgi:hypothetical protein